MGCAAANNTLDNFSAGPEPPVPKQQPLGVRRELLLKQLFRFGAGQAIQNRYNFGSGAGASRVLLTKRTQHSAKASTICWWDEKLPPSLLVFVPFASRDYINSFYLTTTATTQTSLYHDIYHLYHHFDI
eukprot:COSAG01_NODE_4692_length_4808_cov_9.520493_2_plen_129_part_00